MERIIGYAWATAKAIIVVAFVLAIIIGAALPGAKRKLACEHVGGHFVSGPPFADDECWAADGRTRLFPEGF